MNLATITQPAVKLGWKLYGKACRYAPEILLGAGVTSMILGAVVGCERTTHAEELLDATKKQLDDIRTVDENPNISYSEQEKRKDLTLVYTKAGVGFAKLYLPAVALEGVGVACILASYGIMRGRNAALTAAYTALQNTYSRYRERVIEECGEEADRYFRTGLKTKAVEIIEKDENGNEKRVQTEQAVFDNRPEEPSVFGRWFDERNPNFSKYPYNNLSFLMSVQKQAQNQLMVHGHLFLNDVYSMLGFPHVPQGQAVGWLRDDAAGGKGYVDFGIHDGMRQAARDFVNGYEKAIFLDFNIDPVPIWDKI